MSILSLNDKILLVISGWYYGTLLLSNKEKQVLIIFLDQKSNNGDRQTAPADYAKTTQETKDSSIHLLSWSDILYILYILFNSKFYVVSIRYK